jgi:2-oxoisovalerate dehydrogenase E1 component alpha subunit
MTGHQGGAGHSMVQLITPAGERVSHPEYDPWVKDVSDEQLCSLYEDLVVIRRIDKEATALQRQGELGPLAAPAGPGGLAGGIRAGTAG